MGFRLKLTRMAAMLLPTTACRGTLQRLIGRVTTFVCLHLGGPNFFFCHQGWYDAVFLERPPIAFRVLPPAPPPPSQVAGPCGSPLYKRNALFQVQEAGGMRISRSFVGVLWIGFRWFLTEKVMRNPWACAYNELKYADNIMKICSRF